MVTRGKKWRFADKDLKNADWCFESPLLPLLPPKCHVIPSDREGSPDTSAILAHLQFRHFFPCLPHMPCHPERQRGISLFFRYFHTFPTPSLRPYCAGINFISFRRLLLRRLFLEGPSYYKYRQRGSLAPSLKLPGEHF